jgi:hypothetical protein
MDTSNSKHNPSRNPIKETKRNITIHVKLWEIISNHGWNKGSSKTQSKYNKESHKRKDGNGTHFSNEEKKTNKMKIVSLTTSCHNSLSNTQQPPRLHVHHHKRHTVLSRRCAKSDDVLFSCPAIREPYRLRLRLRL